MIRSIVCWSMVVAGLVACSGEGDGGGNGGGSNGGKTTSPAPAKASGTDFGPKCQAYVDCCKKVASSAGASGASLTQACDSWKSSYDQSRQAGATVESFESACTSALSSLQGAGYCK